MGQHGVLEVMLGSTCGGRGIGPSPYYNELCALTVPFAPPHIFFKVVDLKYLQRQVREMLK